MKYAGGFNVTLPAKREILLTRTFEAPRAAVFEAWTNAEQVKHWWDPSGVPLSCCEIELRPGGSFRWVNSAHGAEHVFTGTYCEIAPPERLVFTAHMFPSSPGALTHLTFSEDEGRTKLTMRIECASVEERDALLRIRIDQGTGRTLENLDRYLKGVISAGERAPLDARLRKEL
jgi:uncharacterized protein YndB with AHSA1/START domain